MILCYLALSIQNERSVTCIKKTNSLQNKRQDAYENSIIEKCESATSDGIASS